MSSVYVGRQYELQTLADLWKKNTPSLVVIKGRRRIGKSRLIQEFGRNVRILSFSGLPPTQQTTAQSQIDFFMRDLCRQTDLPELSVDDWMKAFHLLYKSLSQEPTVIALDEISWMGSCDPDFMGKLKTAWDNYFKNAESLVFILSGSLSYWIDKNILSSTGFLGRLSAVIDLKELSLKESHDLLLSQGVKESPHNLFKILSITGGVPRYLEEIKPHLTVEQNIQSLCFSSSGILYREFDDIFSDLFDHRKEFYKKIVLSLADGKKYLKELSQVLNLKQNGDLTDYMDHLLKSGFVERDYSWKIHSKKISRLSQFRISDNYIRFYLKYVLPNKVNIQQETFSLSISDMLPGYASIMGLQFENLVHHNRQRIWDMLRIVPGDIVSDGSYFQRSTSRHSGCQVDYMIQTKHNVLYVCEVKYINRDPSTIDWVTSIEDKARLIAAPKNFSKRIVFIHTHDDPSHIQGKEYHWDVINFTQMINTHALKDSKG